MDRSEAVPRLSVDIRLVLNQQVCDVGVALLPGQVERAEPGLGLGINLGQQTSTLAAKCLAFKIIDQRNG